MTQKFALLATLVLLPLVQTINVAEARGRMDRREAHQGARIRQGVRSGQLTRGEAKNLRSEQRKIHRAERRAKADGVVSPRERAHIGRMQTKASHDIREAKHNENTRGDNSPAADPLLEEPNNGPELPEPKTN